MDPGVFGIGLEQQIRLKSKDPSEPRGCITRLLFFFPFPVKFHCTRTHLLRAGVVRQEHLHDVPRRRRPRDLHGRFPMHRLGLVCVCLSVYVWMAIEVREGKGGWGGDDV